jgi:hypothetical protein
MSKSRKPRLTAEDRRELASALGYDRASDDDEPTLDEIRAAVRTESSPELVSRGEGIREDLSEELDEELLEEALAAMPERLERLEAIREVGVPRGEEGAEELYRELLDPFWLVYYHLEEAGFFESVEEHLPAFTPEHIEHTAHELIRADPLTGALEECGFDEHERTALMMNVANNDVRLSRWVPTREIPDGVEFDVDYVPPLHQRATGGALLWMNALDEHLWRKEILITEEILDDAAWHSKELLGGLYLFSRAAREIGAGEDASLSDAQLTAALTASSAMLIVAQEELMKDVFWITEERRAPTRAR